MNVGHLLTRAALRYPEHTAWLSDDKRVMFREAEARTNALANALLDLGLRHGDRVGMLLQNCPEGLETILAPMKAGLTAVPLNVRLHPSEHLYILNDSGCRALVYGAMFDSHLNQVRGSLKSTEVFIRVGDGATEDLSYEELVAGGSPRVPGGEVQREDVAWVFYTSGTTGQPKGAMLSHRSLLNMASNFLMDINPAKPDDVLLHAAPITHGSGMCLFHHVARGATNAFPWVQHFDPPGIFAAIERYRVTTMFLAPTMINLLVASPERTKYDLSSLHTIIYGGAPMYTPHILEAIRAFGNIFVQIFAQGESPMTVTTLPKEEHIVGDDQDRLRRLGSAGREVTGVRVSIFDDQDRELPAGEVGEIVVRGDLVMQGYWNKREATAETLRGGWLHTGDVGYLDADGYLFITDRKKDMIITGGANVYPREVEEVIAKHPAVAEVAVIGVPDELWGESIKALVVLRPSAKATAEEMINYCRDHLASYKKPKSVEFLPAIPKNAYGKVLKRELREPYWVGRERRV
ncbi:MAG: long-chain fatty acid--CoA ligase [Chloroflexi bacterium]|nr:long-chain fatty acid--CoA ligase [Chloroflexota bacterium]